MPIRGFTESGWRILVSGLVCLVFCASARGAEIQTNVFTLNTLGANPVETGLFTLDTRTQANASLTGVVSGKTAQGSSLGVLSGATVQISGGPSTTTDSKGQFSFANLQAGTVSLTISRSGYHSVNRSVTLTSGSTVSETIALTAVTVAADPVAYDFASPNGRYLIPAMPNDVQFSIVVDWKGTPGAVVFIFAGKRHTATLSDLGNGRAKATLTLRPPFSISARSELRVEVTNGEGKTVTVNTGVILNPMPGILSHWATGNKAWTSGSTALNYSDSRTFTLWDVSIPSGVYSSNASLGYDMDVKYDLRSGEFSGSFKGNGAYGQKTQFQQVETIGQGRLAIEGSLSVSLAGGSTPSVSPYWTAELSGKAGMGWPVVLVVDVLFPPASPFVHGALKVPVVGDVIGATKLRLFLIAGGSVTGVYERGQWGDGFLGATGISAKTTLGLEGQIVTAVGAAEAGVTAGISGTPEWTLHPNLRFTGATVRGYVEVFYSWYKLTGSREFAVQIRFDAAGNKSVEAFPISESEELVWEPVGRRLRKFGAPYEPVSSLRKTVPPNLGQAISSGSEEEVLVANVLRNSAPTLILNATETHVFFAQFDPDKPDDASTDIGLARSRDGSPWAMSRVSDSDTADFSPQALQQSNGDILAAWVSISGQDPGAPNPEQFSPYLEISASRYDHNTGLWNSPAKITNNLLLDRDPLLISTASGEGVLWIQNEASDFVGNATHGDRLLFAQWNGQSWSPASTVWEDKKGLLTKAFVLDASGVGHLVVSADEDGDPLTRSDREIHYIRYEEGVWSEAARLTDDDIEDSQPVLVTPGDVPMLVWSASEELFFSLLDDWQPRPLPSVQPGTFRASGLSGCELPGGAAIAYTIQNASGTDIAVSYYDSFLGIWSRPRQLTVDDSLESAISIASDGGGLAMTYLKTETIRSSTDVVIDGQTYRIDDIPFLGRTDIAFLRHELGDDLAVASSSIEFSTPNPRPGDVVWISALIENRGDNHLQDVPIVFYDGNPAAGGSIIGASQIIQGVLTAGEQRPISVQWVVPLDLVLHEIFVVVDPEQTFEDRDRSNNAASAFTVLPDLEIASFYSTDIGSATRLFTARVINSGAIPAATNLIAFDILDGTGERIALVPIPRIPDGGFHDVEFTWNAADRVWPQQEIRIQATVDPQSEVNEFDEANNNAALVARAASFVGDANGDGKMDSLDFFYFAQWWQEDVNETNYRCNLVEDESINEQDLLHLMERW